MTKITSSSTTESLPKGINIIINNKIESEAQPIPIVRKKRRKRRKPVIPQLQEEFKLPAPVADASYVQKPTLPTSWRNTLNTDPQGTINPVITDDQKKALGFYNEDPPQKQKQITYGGIDLSGFYKAIQNMQLVFTNNDSRIKGGGASAEEIENEDPIYKHLPDDARKQQYVDELELEAEADADAELQKVLAKPPVAGVTLTPDEQKSLESKLKLEELKKTTANWDKNIFKSTSTRTANAKKPPVYTFNKIYMENYLDKIKEKLTNETVTTEITKLKKLSKEAKAILKTFK